MRRHRLMPFALSLSLLLPLGAVADGSARFSTGNPNVPSLTFSWQDGNRSRLDSPNQPAHVLAIDGKAWGVASIGGQTVSMDLNSLRDLLGPNSGLGRIGPGTVVPARLTALEPTGRAEVVAGIPGEIYYVSWEDNEGRGRISEAVLTDNALVREMQAALVGDMAQALARESGLHGQEQAHMQLEQHGLAVLRFGDDFQLEAIEGNAQPAERFRLPGSSLDLRRMMRGLMGG